MNKTWSAPLLLALLLSPFPSTVAQSDETFDAVDFVDSYYSRFQKPGFLVGDLMEFYDEDVLFSDPTFEIVAEGKDEVALLYADLGTDRTAYENIEWDITRVIAQGDLIVIRGVWSGRFAGCDFETDFMTLWRLRDGKIVEQNDFFAAAAFDRQVGWDGERATCPATEKSLPTD